LRKGISVVLVPFWTLVLLGFVLLPVNTASAVPVVDQRQTAINTSFTFAVGGGSNQKLAQVVTAGVSGTLTEVRFPVGCSTGSSLTVEIQGVSAGIPNGVVLASQVQTGLPIVVSTTFKSLTFSSPTSVTTGTQFAIVLSATGSCGVFPRPVGNPYVGGNAFFQALPNPPNQWNSLSIGTGIFDLPFQTVVDVIADTIIGGELIPLDTTTLLLAGVQTNLAWMIPVALSAVGIGIFILKKKF